MKAIDTHAHIFPEKIEKKAVESISKFYEETPMKHSGSVEELLKSGNKIGVEKYLVFSTATKAEQVKSINDFIISQINTYPMFIGLGTIYKGFEDYKDELLKLKNAGINGVKLHPDFQKFRFDDPDLYPIYDTLSELNMFVMTHAGDYRYQYSNPQKIADIAKKFKKLNIIAAHFGGWSEWDIANQFLNLENVYFDTSSTMGFKGLQPAKNAFKSFDNTHIFFGTDFPMWDHVDELNFLKKLNLSDKIFEDVMYNNFVNFYKQYE